MTASLVLLLASAVLVLPGRWPLPTRERTVLRRRHRTADERDAATLAELFAAALDSGLSPADATATLVTDPALREEATASPERWWSKRVPAVARALVVSERLGSPAARAVRSAADAVRARSEAQAALQAGLAGLRATAWLLTALPVLGAVGAAVVAPPTGAAAPIAWGSTLLGAGFTLAGWAWLRRLVRRTQAVLS